MICLTKSLDALGHDQLLLKEVHWYATSLHYYLVSCSSNIGARWPRDCQDMHVPLSFMNRSCRGLLMSSTELFANVVVCSPTVVIFNRSSCKLFVHFHVHWLYLICLDDLFMCSIRQIILICRGTVTHLKIRCWTRKLIAWFHTELQIVTVQAVSKSCQLMIDCCFLLLLPIRPVSQNHQGTLIYVYLPDLPCDQCGAQLQSQTC